MTSAERITDEWGRVWLPKAEAAVALLYAGGDLQGVGFDPEDPMVIEFNRWTSHFDKDEEIIGPLPEPTAPAVEEHATRIADWTIPESFASLDLAAHLLSLCKTEQEMLRIEQELVLYEEKGLTPLLRIAMMLVDHFRRNKIVWGVGRGSSVASYALYLIGLTRVNPIEFDIPITEFLR